MPDVYRVHKDIEERQKAPFPTTAAWTSDATWLLILARGSLMVQVLAAGRTKPTPQAGQDGRLPQRADQAQRQPFDAAGDTSLLALDVRQHVLVPFITLAAEP
jgi:hypothetical protein